MIESKPLDFDFVSDEKFRASLVNDYREMKACEDAESWKAIYVLAGSIVEALLVEYLAISSIRPDGKDPLNIDLAKAIEACQIDGVIRKETASLCEVIREYRNLIHPGRAIRLNQNISPEGALIASNLVSLIAKEVAGRRKIKYGPTAEQIVKKLRGDQHSLALLPELLSETKEHERIRLVASVIPDAYLDEESFVPNDGVLDRLRICYRQVLEGLPVPEQTRVAEQFSTSVRNDSDQKIQAFGDIFFSAKDIMYLQPKDAGVVVTYLLTRLADPTTTITKAFVESLGGIGKFVPSGAFAEFADTLIKLSLRRTVNGVKVSEFVTREYDNVPEEDARETMTKRLSAWIETGKEKPFSDEQMERLEHISNWWIEIPF